MVAVLTWASRCNNPLKSNGDWRLQDEIPAVRPIGSTGQSAAHARQRLEKLIHRQLTIGDSLETRLFLFEAGIVPV
jgi:hypothetical protein